MKTGCYSRMEIEAFQPSKDSVLVCIHDPGSEPPKVAPNLQGWVRVSFHSFWDVENDKYGYAPATEKDFAAIKDILDCFSEGHNIFASCEAGISRSAAVREFLLRRGYTYLNEAQKNRMVHPNSYILAGLERLDRELKEGEDYVR